MDRNLRKFKDINKLEENLYEEQKSLNDNEKDKSNVEQKKEKIAE